MKLLVVEDDAQHALDGLEEDLELPVDVVAFVDVLAQQFLDAHDHQVGLILGVAGKAGHAQHLDAPQHVHQLVHKADGRQQHIADVLRQIVQDLFVVELGAVLKDDEEEELPDHLCEFLLLVVVEELEDHFLLVFD